MKDRTEYRKYSTDDFAEELSSRLKEFIDNMHHIEVDNLSFPEWYETFGAWLEVDTSVEDWCWK